jgi:hypothetical protein
MASRDAMGDCTEQSERLPNGSNAEWRNFTICD